MSILVNRWQDFARITVQTHDLDPMYDLIHNANLAKGRQWTERFCTHFFMFYNAGEAARAANQGDKFWDYTEEHYDSFKRGTERRHFRGVKGLIAVRKMRKQANLWPNIWERTYSELVSNILYNFKGCQIGPYFMWKAMDILDRGLNLPVNLTRADAVKWMPDEPRKCAETIWPGKPLGAVLQKVVYSIEDLPAPGNPNRMCSYPEAETILCMLKGYFLTKTHQIGDDIQEKHMQLADFPDLLPLLPKRIDINDYKRGTLDPSLVSTGSVTILA